MSIVVKVPGQPDITYTPQEIQLVKDTFAVGATDNELKLFLYIARKLGLDIFTRQIHFVKRKRKNTSTGQWEEIAAYQIGIDGYVQLAQQVKDTTGQVLLDGFSTKPIMEAGKVVGAKATVWRKDFKNPVEVEVDFNEYAAKTGDGKLTHMWQDKPKIMIEKCALALALRRTFPQTFSGTYVPEELEDTIPAIDLKTEKEETTAPPSEPEKAETRSERYKKLVNVRFLKDCPEFIALDGKTYGPFKEEAVANIPEGDVDLMVKNGIIKVYTLRDEQPPKTPKPEPEKPVTPEKLQEGGVTLEKSQKDYRVLEAPVAGDEFRAEMTVRFNNVDYDCGSIVCKGDEGEIRLSKPVIADLPCVIKPMMITLENMSKEHGTFYYETKLNTDGLLESVTMYGVTAEIAKKLVSPCGWSISRALENMAKLKS